MYYVIIFSVITVEHHFDITWSLKCQFHDCECVYSLIEIEQLKKHFQNMLCVGYHIKISPYYVVSKVFFIVLKSHEDIFIFLLGDVTKKKSLTWRLFELLNLLAKFDIVVFAPVCVEIVQLISCKGICSNIMI